jgi:hypothetical protein
MDCNSHIRQESWAFSLFRILLFFIVGNFGYKKVGCGLKEQKEASKKDEEGENKLLKCCCDYKILDILACLCNSFRSLYDYLLKNRTCQKVLFLSFHSDSQEYLQKLLLFCPAQELSKFDTFGCKNFVEWILHI